MPLPWCFIDSMTAPDEPATDADWELFEVALRLELADAEADEADSSRLFLLVNTRLDNFRSVCVRFRDASASAGLSVFSSCCSALGSTVGEYLTAGGAGVAVDVDGFGWNSMLVEGRWWNGIGRGGLETLFEYEQHASSSFGSGCWPQLLLQLMLRRLHKHEVKLAAIGSTDEAQNLLLL
jgi:hypothetical protein